MQIAVFFVFVEGDVAHFIDIRGGVGLEKIGGDANRCDGDRGLGGDISILVGIPIGTVSIVSILKISLAYSSDSGCVSAMPVVMLSGGGFI